MPLSTRLHSSNHTTAVNNLPHSPRRNALSGNLRWPTVIAACALLASCASSMIAVRPGSESVAVWDANQVTQCQTRGSINVSVLSEVGIFTRSADAVEGNLLQLARNGAVDAHADTIVKGNSTTYGKRTFDMYKCR